MVKTSVRGKGTRGGGSGRGGGAGRGKEPAGETGASGGGGSGRGGAGETGASGGGGSGRGYIPLGELAAIAAARTAKARGKGIATGSREKDMSTSSHEKDKGKSVDGGRSSSLMGDDSETQTPVRKGPNSSHDSSVSRPSPPSHGTHHSTGNESNSRSSKLPRQYPASSNLVHATPNLRRTNLNLNIQPQQQLQVQNHVQEEEEDDEGDAEEHDDDDDDMEPDDIEHGEEDGDDADDGDYDQLLADAMADPARQSLPLLSEQPHPERDTIW